MNLLLAVKATVDSDKIQVPDGAKDALAPVLTSRPALAAAIFGVCIGIVMWKRTRPLLKFLAAGLVALIVIGWDAQPNHGVASAMVGSREQGSLLILAVALVLFCWGVWRMPEKRTSASAPDAEGMLKNLLGGNHGGKRRRRRGR